MGANLFGDCYRDYQYGDYSFTCGRILALLPSSALHFLGDLLCHAVSFFVKAISMDFCIYSTKEPESKYEGDRVCRFSTGIGLSGMLIS